MTRRRLGLVALAVAGAYGLFVAAQAQDIVPRITGAEQPMAEIPAPPLPNWIVDDVRVGRNYPEQPPVIPHSIDGYQVSINANRCLECHRREFSGFVSAPMISITHFQDRDGQMLADVAPRRYFCMACHVPQADAQPLIENDFRDMLMLSPLGGQ